MKRTSDIGRTQDASVVLTFTHVYRHRGSNFFQSMLQRDRGAAVASQINATHPARATTAARFIACSRLARTFVLRRPLH